MSNANSANIDASVLAGTGQALLEAIRNCASDADPAGLEALSNAYATVLGVIK